MDRRRLISTAALAGMCSRRPAVSPLRLRGQGIGLRLNLVTTDA